MSSIGISRVLRDVCERCHSEPFTVIPTLSGAKGRNLALPVQGELREESRSGKKGLGRFLPFAPLSRKSPEAGHSRESGNPGPCGLTWTPAYAGVTTGAILISLGGPQAHAHSGSE